MNPALLIAARILLSSGAGQVELEPAVVKLEHASGRELWTVRARSASAAALLARVSELSGRAIDATTAVEHAALITIELDRRPLEELLEFALGSAGLRVEVDDTTIHVCADRPAEDTPDRRADYAVRAWARAAARYPRHAIAATARLAQGELEELRGRADSARSRYIDVLTRHPSSPAAGEAYLRSGRMAAARGAWGEASEHFRALANLPGAEEYHAIARVELARATLRLGDPDGALHILDALEVGHPGWERTEITTRTLLRVEALLAGSRFQDALDVLDARCGDLDELVGCEIDELRARALEGAGMSDEASRAWLLVARARPAPTSAAAYRNAARLAEAAGDPKDVLFVAREADTAGLASTVSDYEDRARASLGVEQPAPGAYPTGAERLVQAEHWLEQRDHERASLEFERLHAESGRLALAPVESARVALGWLRCLVPERGLEAVAALARTERERLAPGDARRQLDLGLARLFEEHGLFERAADAYLGDYETMLRFHTTVSSLLAAALVVPVFIGQGQVSTLKDALAGTQRALEVLKGLEQKLTEEPAAALELIRSATEAPAGDETQRDQHLERLRSEVNLLQMELDSMQSPVLASDGAVQSALGARTPLDGDAAAPLAGITTGLDESMRALLGGAPAPRPERRAEVAAPRSASPGVEPQVEEPPAIEILYTADPLRHGITCYRAGRYAEAYELLRSLEDASALYWRARTLERLERLDEAVTIMERAIAKGGEGFEQRRAQTDLEFLRWKRDFVKSLPEGSAKAGPQGEPRR